MNRNTTTLLFGALSLAFLIFSPATPATEYIFRDLMGNTIPPASCKTESEAQQQATDPYNLTKASKRFCELQGYGWHLTEEKSSGRLVCEECTDAAFKGKYRCHLEDVTVSCRRIKPGSVGMLPGKG